MTAEFDTSRRRLSLVMPAYNEEAGIETAVAEARESLIGLDLEFELIVVDDGSTDRTTCLVGELAALWPDVHFARHERNRGYGAALRTGFQLARFPLVAFTDADGQFYLEDIERLLDLADRYTIVVGRRLKRQDSWRRLFFSWGYNKLVRLLLSTRVHDCDCALKLYRRDVLAHLLPQSEGFFVNAEMLCRARRLGLPIAEVAVRHRPRRRGTSTVSLLDIPRTLRSLLPFWWMNVVRSGRRVGLESPTYFHAAAPVGLESPTYFHAAAPVGLESPTYLHAVAPVGLDSPTYFQVSTPDKR